MKAISSARVTSTDKNYRHNIMTGVHPLVADEPVHAGGQDAGPAPYDFVLAGLGACTAITLRMYAEKKGWELGEFRVELTLLKNREGEARIERQLKASRALTDEQWERLLAMAEKTPVTLTLKSGTPISTQRAT